MYDDEVVRAAQRLVLEGHTISAVARQLRVSRAAVRSWLPIEAPAKRRVCPALDPQALDVESYLYLLGQYLGDGSIDHYPRDVYRLRIACTTTYGHLIELCRRAMATCVASRVSVIQSKGCVYVNSYSKHWPCLFPQHGPGPKHLREIKLVDWQLLLIKENPWPLIRGLIHSDGCRDMNPVNGKDYVRYSFCNVSEDIKNISTAACDQVGVRWTRANTKVISIARRDSVALMEAQVGAKS